MLIIKGVHQGVDKEYAWVATARLKKKQVNVGDKLWVETRLGNKCITVTEVIHKKRSEFKEGEFIPTARAYSHFKKEFIDKRNIGN